MTGLESNQWVRVKSIDALFRAPSGIRTSIAHNAHFRYGGSLNRELYGDSSLQSLIHAWFPLETRWKSEIPVNDNPYLPAHHSNPDQEVDLNEKGDFVGAIEFTKHNMERILRTPIKAGQYDLDPGARLILEKVSASDSSLSINLAIQEPASWVRKDYSIPEWFSLHREMNTDYMLVVFHPDSREAFWVSPTRRGHIIQQSVLSMTRKTRYVLDLPAPAAERVLTGISLEQWLAKAELHTFRIRQSGYYRFHFNADDYTLIPKLSRNAGIHDSLRPSQQLRDLTLSENADESETLDFLNAVLSEIPENWNQTTVNLIRSKLESIGKSRLPVLLSMLPVDSTVLNSHLRPVIGKMLQKKHLPAVRELLTRDMQLIGLVVQKGWEKDIQDIVLEQLSQRNDILPQLAIRIAA
ncbi:MAG TPA: hypothetical protein EYQ50_22575, partial [Verrucomicrobiales bacterium]|nr:hypothetical protein [Verrucomicrobiales bacterium]